MRACWKFIRRPTRSPSHGETVCGSAEHCRRYSLRSLSGIGDGVDAGSAAGIVAAVVFGAERRLGAALRAGFFFVDRLADAFAVLRFLRAEAAFLVVDRFFAFFLFAISLSLSSIDPKFVRF